jgi:hypothetical protein
MRVIVGCESSGKVRDAFIRSGHYAISCDLLPTDVPGPHYQGDLFDIIDDGFDLGIFHPPCTYLTVSNNGSMANGCSKYTAEEGKILRQEGIDFFMRITKCKIPRWAIENPIGIMSSLYRTPNQIIQPFNYGHGETKATCLWLRRLPRLNGFDVVEGREQRIWKMGPSEDRWKKRSETFDGIADAMAKQWGYFEPSNFNQGQSGGGSYGNASLF